MRKLSPEHVSDQLFSECGIVDEISGVDNTTQLRAIVAGMIDGTRREAEREERSEQSRQELDAISDSFDKQFSADPALDDQAIEIARRRESDTRSQLDASARAFGETSSRLPAELSGAGGAELHRFASARLQP
jgi:hypothetical protein